MRCEQARQLFDAYLDGELSTALATELGAHRLRCANCRRELALLEVASHVLRTDTAPAVTEDFTDRLLRCVEESPRWRWAKIRRMGYIAVPLAAAAVVLLAFVGVFDGRGASKVAGVQELNPATGTTHNYPALPGALTPIPVEVPQDHAPSSSGVAFEDWLRLTEENVESGKRTGESLQNVLDGTFVNVLRLLEDSDESNEMLPASRPEAPAGEAGLRGAAPPLDKPAKKKSDVEDL